MGGFHSSEGKTKLWEHLTEAAFWETLGLIWGWEEGMDGSGGVFLFVRYAIVKISVLPCQFQVLSFISPSLPFVAAGHNNTSARFLLGERGTEIVPYNEASSSCFTKLHHPQ